MPLQGIHILVLDEAQRKLAAEGSGAAASAGEILAAHPLFGAAGTAAQDLLYFAPDTGPRAEEAVSLLVDLLEPLAPLFELKSDYVDPLTDDIEQGLDWVTGGLFGEYLTTVEAISAALRTLIQGFVSSRIDPWEILLPPPPIASGHREVAGGDSWYWGDMLHYRCTGRFAQALFDNAAGDEELAAFALGAAAHVGTDVTVHPFVNAIVGGPYRNHPHRHHFVENFIETLAWSRLVGGNVLDAGLVERMNLSNIVPLPSSALEILSRVTLPEKLIDLLDRTMREVYPTPPERLPGGYLAPQSLDFSYRLFLLLTRLSSNKLDPPEPPEIGAAALQDLLDKLSLDPPPGPPSGELCFSLACAAELFESVVDFADWAIDQVRKIAAIAAQAAATLLALATAPAKYVLYLVQSVAYNVYRTFRRILVWMGLAVPFDLQEALALDEEYRANRDLGHGRSLLAAPFDPGYPRRPSPTGFFGRVNLRGKVEAMHHVPYPRSDSEHPVLVSSLDLHDAIERVLRSGPFSEASVEELLSATSPEGTDELTSGTPLGFIPPEGLGNAIDFSAFLIREAVEGKLARHQWNLDADRGYGWKAWSWGPDRPALGSPGTAQVDAFYIECP